MNKMDLFLGNKKNVHETGICFLEVKKVNKIRYFFEVKKVNKTVYFQEVNMVMEQHLFLARGVHSPHDWLRTRVHKKRRKG